MTATNTGCGVRRDLDGKPFYCVSDLSFPGGSHIHSMRKLAPHETIPVTQIPVGTNGMRMHARRDQLTHV